MRDVGLAVGDRLGLRAGGRTEDDHASAEAIAGVVEKGAGADQDALGVKVVNELMMQLGQLLPAERELGRRVEVWGGLATAWSAYVGRNASGTFHERGINSFQLVKVDGKWLVASILWQEATPDNPLPADLIQGRKK